MAIPVVVTNGCGRAARIDANGDFVVTTDPLDISEFREFDVPDIVAYNFFEPKMGYNFVVTGIHAFADKDVSNSVNATVFIYEAPAIDSTTVDKVILRFEMPRDSTIPLTGLRILVNSGKWVNGKTNDDDIHVNLFGHYKSMS